MGDTENLGHGELAALVCRIVAKQWHINEPMTLYTGGVSSARKTYRVLLGVNGTGAGGLEQRVRVIELVDGKAKPPKRTVAHVLRTAASRRAVSIEQGGVTVDACQLALQMARGRDQALQQSASASGAAPASGAAASGATASGAAPAGGAAAAASNTPTIFSLDVINGIRNVDAERHKELSVTAYFRMAGDSFHLRPKWKKRKAGESATLGASNFGQAGRRGRRSVGKRKASWAVTAELKSVLADASVRCEELEKLRVKGKWLDCRESYALTDDDCTALCGEHGELLSLRDAHGAVLSALSLLGVRGGMVDGALGHFCARVRGKWPPRGMILAARNVKVGVREDVPLTTAVELGIVEHADAIELLQRVDGVLALRIARSMRALADKAEATAEAKKRARTEFRVRTGVPTPGDAAADRVPDAMVVELRRMATEASKVAATHVSTALSIRATPFVRPADVRGESQWAVELHSRLGKSAGPWRVGQLARDVQAGLLGDDVDSRVLWPATRVKRAVSTLHDLVGVAYFRLGARFARVHARVPERSGAE